MIIMKLNTNKQNKKRRSIPRIILVVIAALFFWGILSTTSAQAGVNLNSNLDSQPAWGPAGYDYVEYYYLPDLNIYYYVPQHGYYYYTRRQWFYSSTLPSVYSNYDFYTSYKIVMNERAPWRNNQNHIERYSSFKGRQYQLLIRDTRDTKYSVNKKNPQNNRRLRQLNDNNINNKSPQQDDNRDN